MSIGKVVTSENNEINQDGAFEIGRASCRERVEIPGDAGLVRKKKSE